MKKKQIITFLLLGTLIIALNSLSLCFFVTKGNNWRINKANSLYETSRNTAELRNRLIILIQSNILMSSESKNLEIADIYLELGDFNNARSYLNRVKNQDGYLKYAEFALEKGEFTVANEYITRITDGGKRNELYIFLEITQNEKVVDNIKKLPMEPQTNLGIILKALNTGNFENITKNSLLGEKIAKIRESYPEKTRSALEIVNMLVQEKQPILARILLNDLESEHSGLTDLYVIKAASYVVQNDYQNGLKYQLLAIKTNPADITLYKTALSYAELAGDASEISLLKENITYLELIKSKTFCTKCGV